MNISKIHSNREFHYRDIMRIHEISMSAWWRPSLSGGHQAPRWRILRIHLPGDHRFLPWPWVQHGAAGLKMLEEDFTTWEVSQVSRSWADSQEIYWDLTFLGTFSEQISRSCTFWLWLARPQCRLTDGAFTWLCGWMWLNSSDMLTICWHMLRSFDILFASFCFIALYTLLTASICCIILACWTCWKWVEIELKWLDEFIPAERVFAKVALRRVPARQGLCLSNCLDGGYNGLWNFGTSQGSNRSDAFNF